jgi:fumigallin biosynthesis monooxygenase-like protein
MKPASGMRWEGDANLREEHMANVVTGRYTAQADGSLVVFLIGMRINRLWAVRKWVPTFLAMVRMLPLLIRKSTVSG